LGIGSLRAALGGREPGERITGAPPTRTSAVLVPLYEHYGEPWVILTRRAGDLRSHSLEVSFPGGRQDDGEHLWDTARREAHEEIGLDPSDVELIGRLDRLRTVSSASAIHPYVAVLPEGRPRRLVANPAEVETILHVPLADLVRPEVYREERWHWPEAAMERPIWFFELVGDTVWGATASMLRLLLVIGLELEDQ
jgi:8-oxo-dGTP pyrophosphatase MutT (NUDIX family)